MNQKNIQKPTLIICITIFLSIVSFSGCVDNQNTVGEELVKFIGTWTGNMEIPIFGGGNNSIITKLIFMENIVEMTMTSERGNYTTNYTYTIEGDKLVLVPKFDNNQGFFGRPSFNDTRPWNDTRPFNDTRPPNNSTWPPNRTQPPNDGQQLPGGQRPSMSISFFYNFNNEYNVLYLNESQFIKFK